MATVSKWTPFGVALDITASSASVTRTSATKYTVKINASWETYYSSAQTNYGMTASSGGSSVTLNAFGTKSSGGSGSFTGTYTISGNGSATKTITVTFRNFNNDNDNSATKNVTFNVTVPAWTSYTIKYNTNGGSGSFSNQTKWKDQALKLHSTKPTRTGYSFLGWSTSSTATTATYSAGGSYTANAAATLYAVWKANTYTITYNANGGTGAPANQTKTYGKTLTLSSTKPTRTNHTFKGWGTAASSTTATYSAGGSYTANAAATLYAVWELSYVKPTISNLKVSRCNSSGTVIEDGTCALVKFDWETSLTVSSVTVSWVNSGTQTSATGQEPIAASGTSGSVSHILKTNTYDAETSYTFTVTVADSNGNSDRSVTMTGIEYHLDLSERSVAIGKPAENLTFDGSPLKVFDVKWRGKFREYICVGDKLGYHDGKQGIYLNNEGYIHLQRSSAEGYHPYISFYVDNATSANATIRLNSSTKDMEFQIANTEVTATYCPYRRKGDSMTLTIRTAGFVTNASTEVHFFIPFAEPVIGAPTVTVTSGNGFTLRQGNKYTHGSSVSVSVSPRSYAATLYSYNGIHVKATFSDITNVTNNDSIGIQWNGTITFS